MNKFGCAPVRENKSRKVSVRGVRPDCRKKALEDEVSFLKSEKKKTEIAHKNAVAHVVEDRILKLETQ